MIIYDASKSEFRSHVRDNSIDKKIQEKFLHHLGIKVSNAEIVSWKSSLQYMSNILESTDIPNDSRVALEYCLPKTSKRIDFIISGLDAKKNPSLVVVELKQWAEAQKTDVDGVVRSFVGGAERDLTHPSYQAWSYCSYLEDFSEVVQSDNVSLHPCAYLHNCENSKELKDAFYGDILDKAPLFDRTESQKLHDFISKHVRYGDDKGILYKIDKGSIRPTKKLADALTGMLEGKAEFILIDDQKVIFETALAKISDSSAKNKNVIIVKGGPGTGKSVVAVNLLVRAIAKGLNAQYVSKNSAPREVYGSKLTGIKGVSRFKSLFVGSGSFTNADKNVFDALIVDEAHRLNLKSGFFSHLGENQIKEIINSAKCSVFFIDEDQKVALDDIGTIDEIKKWAEKSKANIIEMELQSQFRCNGADGYLACLDNTLQIRETANRNLEGITYDFKVFDSALEMHKAIRQKNSSGMTARTVAGYCWDWISAKDTKLSDISIDGLKLRWNLKRYGTKWIIQPDSIDESGCIHTCQGLEVDYIGVIIGPDLKVRNGQIVTDAFERSSADKTIKGFKKLHKQNPTKAISEADKIIRNTYKVLMTRGMKGCYLYCTDKETREHFEAILPKSR